MKPNQTYFFLTLLFAVSFSHLQAFQIIKSDTTAVNKSAKEQSKYLSYHTKTLNALALYRWAVNSNFEDPSFVVDSFYNNNKQYGKRKNMKTYRQIAIDKIKEQKENLKKVDGEIKELFNKYFKNNCCKCGGTSTTLFVRKLHEPQTYYSHLATTYRNESYVFYTFTDFDSASGLGRYFQTDAFYPRDAFSFHPNELCPDSCSRFDKIEFFTGVFYLTYDELLRKSVVNLLTTQNDFNDRKEFEVSIDSKGHLRFDKAFEFKFDNYYPIVQGNYYLEQRKPLQCGDEHTRSVFKTEYDELDRLNSDEISNAMFQISKPDSGNKVSNKLRKKIAQFKGDTIIKSQKDYRDFFYPLKGDSIAYPEIGYVYFGKKDSVDNIRGETFYRYKNFKNIYFNNREIRKEKHLYRIKEQNRTIKPLDILKLRNKVIVGARSSKSNFNDPSIIGEVHPSISYIIMDITKVKSVNTGDSLIWLKVLKREENK